MEDKTAGTTGLTTVQPTSPGALIEVALEKGISPADMTELYALYERDQDRQAKIAFNRAVQAFKQNPPVILKDVRVDYPNKKGGRTKYNHASLDKIEETVRPALLEHGLDFRWTQDQESTPGMIGVGCVLTHIDGHEATVNMKGPADDSGGKGKIQQIGSTTSYLQRYTLMAVLGLVAKGADDDGRRSAIGEQSEENKITDDQVLTIEAFITENELNKANVNGYLMSKGYQEFADLPARQFDSFMAMLERAVT